MRVEHVSSRATDVEHARQDFVASSNLESEVRHDNARRPGREVCARTPRVARLQDVDVLRETREAVVIRAPGCVAELPFSRDAVQVSRSWRRPCEFVPSKKKPAHHLILPRLGHCPREEIPPQEQVEHPWGQNGRQGTLELVAANIKDPCLRVLLHLEGACQLIRFDVQCRHFWVDWNCAKKSVLFRPQGHNTVTPRQRAGQVVVEQLEVLCRWRQDFHGKRARERVVGHEQVLQIGEVVQRTGQRAGHAVLAHLDPLDKGAVGHVWKLRQTVPVQVQRPQRRPKPADTCDPTPVEAQVNDVGEVGDAGHALLPHCELVESQRRDATGAVAVDPSPLVVAGIAHHPVGPRVRLQGKSSVDVLQNDFLCRLDRSGCHMSGEKQHNGNAARHCLSNPQQRKRLQRV